MRVLLLSHYYAPEVGPPQRRWDGLVRELVARGHEVTVVTGVPHYPTGRAAPGAPRGTGTGVHGERVVRVPYVPHDRGRGRRLLDQVVVAALGVVPALFSRPDVVVATVPGMPTLAAGTLVARSLRVPLVVEMRDAWPDLLDDARTGPRWLRALLARAVTRGQRGADTVVCVSEAFAARLRERGVSPVVHLPNGVDLSDVVPRQSLRGPGAHPAAPQGPRAAGPLRVLYAGTVGESQAVHRCVAALGLLPPRTVGFTVVGHGAGLAELRRAVARLPRPADVRMLPAVPPSAVAGLLGDVDTALVCLRDWPAFTATVPSKLYELLASGVHVTAVLDGEAADVVWSSGGGDVVAPGDADGLARLWQALADDPARTEVGEGPRRWVAGHADALVLAGRFVALLEGLGRPG